MAIADQGVEPEISYWQSRWVKKTGGGTFPSVLHTDSAGALCVFMVPTAAWRLGSWF